MCPPVSVLCRHCDVCANSFDVTSHAQIRPLSAPVYPSYTEPREKKPYNDDREFKIDAIYVFEQLNHSDVSEEFSTSRTEHRTCCACGEPIADRFLLEVGGGAWHTGCLRCCVCAVQLDRHPSCFLRDRQVYCKQDYAKSFGAKCSKCCRGISSSDWVRKAREQVYHLACFACDACGRQLSTGEQFALHEDRVLCKPHYLETLDGGSISSDDGCDSEGYHKSKAKRVRTTFTEEQLQVLQANFQLDSNPDGQDLERIAQVTGLSKRVTQVWFQNSRARQKKHQHTGKGKQNQAMSREDAVGFGRPINLHLTYSFQNKPPFVPIDGTSFTDSSMDELSEDSSIHCMQSEV
ncbi:unnamed protein product [Danaus chrysippus]|uniref:(African queen) hypothetical protein n=1 Tax=Danaus chrysippus TaxID=151541 RepID=A0A8J2M9A0_9NEOP|nr:unnamed protein product [Danaus chrysippus]